MCLLQPRLCRGANNSRQTPDGKTWCRKKKEAVLAVSLHTNPPLSTVCRLHYSPAATQIKRSILLKYWHIIRLYEYNVFKVKSRTAPPTSNTTWCIPSSSLLHTGRALWISFLQFASSVDATLSVLSATIDWQLNKYWWGQSINDFHFTEHFHWSTEKMHILNDSIGSTINSNQIGCILVVLQLWTFTTN